ncbi:hypothetical protein CP985_13475 [Malaciobacter mytili LMG 24559]|uniref:Uncharacterized protein n=1 Tax=Malaciobacter mytili LMG 24559 TaxID=1032238 RepID=A0AAX2AG35_9BACT|nr:hypothetical protein [Malaciobacter mytili]AXH16495.1 hypothetical protein AMYT_a0197 [Malaciobacter mytili LMG 24559]RXK13000.1 hypothetical protein CP985_13475 [Malaciobacter mytili LMG 24559]
MNLEQIINSSNSDEEIDNKCIETFINDVQSNFESFLKFPLYKYFVSYSTGIGYIEAHIGMQNKLAKARQKGRGGWWREDCSIELLYKLLEEHETKRNDGNDIDLCNFSMFIYFKEFKK